MKSICLALIASAFVVTYSAAERPSNTLKPSDASVVNDGSHDYDFLLGEFRVHNRVRSREGEPWLEFDGTATQHAYLGGIANIQDYVINRPTGTSRAIAIRAYDPKTRRWAARWIDGRNPHLPLDPPEIGGLNHGVGTLYSDIVRDGKEVRTRFRYTDITATSARWEQAISSDAGKSWGVTWIMEFQRKEKENDGARSENVSTVKHDEPANLSGPRGFDFVLGEWTLHSRTKSSSKDHPTWSEYEGVATQRALMDGSANAQDYVFTKSNKTYRGLAIRAYDPKTEQWAIWWIDGSNPHLPMDPPMKGGFNNGVGAFYGDIMLNGKPVPMRFIWSNITSTSARWEQAVSFDGGKTWDTNWIMTFTPRQVDHHD